MIGLRLHRVNEKSVALCFCARFSARYRLCLLQDDRYDGNSPGHQMVFAKLTYHTYALKCVVLAYIAYWGDSLEPVILRSRVTV